MYLHIYVLNLVIASRWSRGDLEVGNGATSRWLRGGFKFGKGGHIYMYIYVHEYTYKYIQRTNATSRPPQDHLEVVSNAPHD